MDTQITAPHESAIEPVPGTTGSEEGIKDRAASVVSRVSEEIRDETARRAKGFLRGQKEHLSEELHKTAEVFRESGERFQQREQGTAAKYVNRIAAQADRFSKHLSERDLEQLAAEIEDVARKSPMLFLVGAFASGFIMSRFLRSPGDAVRGYVPPETSYGQTH